MAMSSLGSRLGPGDRVTIVGADTHKGWRGVVTQVQNTRTLHPCYSVELEATGESVERYAGNLQHARQAK